MRGYRPRAVPEKPEQIPAFLRLELAAIVKAANRAELFVLLDELHAVPDKLLTGMVALADGTDWNPGAGAGVYAYYGAAWHKLG